MATTAPPRPVSGGSPRGDTRFPLLVGLVLVLAASVIALAVTVSLLAAGDDNDSGARKGSGVSASELRTLAAFTAVDLAGANEMSVRLGEPQQVVVRADDNLLGMVVTEVRGGTLVVSDRGDFTTRSAMSVSVTVPSLRSVTLSGAGQLTVTGVAATTFTARLPGTGTLTVSGRAERVDASVSGQGTARLESLLARDATVSIGGAGSLMVHVTRTLDARVSGTGSIIYTGHPTSVTKNITGVGSIVGS